MRAITHNLLMCNIKKCTEGNKNYPFIIIGKEVVNKECEFDINAIKKLFERQDKKALLINFVKI